MGNLDLNTVTNNFRMYLFLYAVVALILVALMGAAAWQLTVLIWRARVVRQKYEETRALVTGQYTNAFDDLTLNDAWSKFQTKKVSVDAYGPKYTDADFRITSTEDSYVVDAAAATTYLNDAAQCQGSSALNLTDIGSENDNYPNEDSRLCAKRL
jgi:hypothetical protein